jgi:hypothetical protein
VEITCLLQNFKSRSIITVENEQGGEPSKKRHHSEDIDRVEDLADKGKRPRVDDGEADPDPDPDQDPEPDIDPDPDPDADESKPKAVRDLGGPKANKMLSVMKRVDAIVGCLHLAPLQPDEAMAVFLGQEDRGNDIWG